MLFARPAARMSRANFGLLNWLISWLLLMLLKGYNAAIAPTPPTTTTTTVSPSNLLPYFDFDVPRNLTVTVGQTGFLHCRVERLGDKDVSWIRKRDLHILTAGSTTYTSDQRFQVLRPDNSANWTLQIKYPQPRDSGVYECQINTEPKMSLSYTFNVVELKAEIFGPSDLMVKTGSDINLTCKIMQGPHELGNIFWYKGSEMLDSKNENEIDSSMARIRVEDDWSDGLTSRLKIKRAMPGDTGNYTCVPTVAKTSSVYVHVIIGEHPAAMQHNSSSNSNSFYCGICCMLLSIVSCCLQHWYVSGATSETMAALLQLSKLPPRQLSHYPTTVAATAAAAAAATATATTFNARPRPSNRLDSRRLVQCMR
ncbi:zwei Ig domain protein zig-8 isoform X2 [Drosophila sulfurigaster albostrigata]|uniref:zwei Ig domain protein zig-8 isoform X2 n=1 Tax=Drosophila sulfurigaster albostrigata TaxID=89887 RepID=UPI002D219656|nr:zwei Ig domain protein zig-8 isoform X2 [Drosophila sulfurigaster albostrigata]